MSGFQNARAISLACAAANVPANRFVRPSATGIIVVGTSGQDAVGVSLEAYVHADFVAGNASNVIAVAQLDGAKLMVEAGAAIAAGAAIMSNATGKAITAATTGSNILGYAVEAAAADGEMIQIIAAKGSQV